MKKLGVIVLLGSWAAAAFLIVLWLIGLLGAIGGGLIHLALMLAIVVGGIGSVVGLVLLIAGAKPKET